jgi:hypothetical protein
VLRRWEDFAGDVGAIRERNPSGRQMTRTAAAV